RARQDALDADAVAAHHDRHFLASLVEHPRAHALRIARAELEDVSDLERLAHRQRIPAARTAFPGVDGAQVRSRTAKVTTHRDIAQVETVAIRAGHHPGLPGEPLIDEHRKVGNTDAAKRAGVRAHPFENL